MIQLMCFSQQIQLALSSCLKTGFVSFFLGIKTIASCVILKDWTTEPHPIFFTLLINKTPIHPSAIRVPVWLILNVNLAGSWMQADLWAYLWGSFSTWINTVGRPTLKVDGIILWAGSWAERKESMCQGTIFIFLSLLPDCDHNVTSCPVLLLWWLSGTIGCTVKLQGKHKPFL